MAPLISLEFFGRSSVMRIRHNNSIIRGFRGSEQKVLRRFSHEEALEKLTLLALEQGKTRAPNRALHLIRVHEERIWAEPVSSDPLRFHLVFCLIACLVDFQTQNCSVLATQLPKSQSLRRGSLQIVLDVGMPCLHPHPKNLFAFTPCPFVSATPSRLCRSPAVAALQLCMRKYKRIDGARDPRGLSPFSIIAIIFLRVGKGQLTRTPPGVLGRPCPPIPLHRTLKEGHGGGWGEVRRSQCAGDPREGPKPHTA